jgi:hypothetical protein
LATVDRFRKEEIIEGALRRTASLESNYPDQRGRVVSYRKVRAGANSVSNHFCSKVGARLDILRYARHRIAVFQLCMACSKVEILMVAKLEKLSEMAYGKMISSLCRIAPQV